MLKDNFVRICFACIVLLLAVIAYRTNPPSTVLAADPAEYLVTDTNGTVRQDSTTTINSLRAKGWKFYGDAIFGQAHGLVFYK